jgi:precorrin-8X/cobalt-precorrin-8 methylmutase
MIDFDAYLIVDWSAKSKPTRGEDSIWYCMLLRIGDHLREVGPENPATRQEAFERIADLLVENVKRRLVTLVGFDFPYGYPSGFAAALGIKDKGRPAWEQVWDFLSEKIQDKKDNSNNRFKVAAALNKKISDARYPFWGCPTSKKCRTLLPTKLTETPPRIQLGEKRITECHVGTAKSVWQLYGRGSVGSQALMGIPYVARLHNHPDLAKLSRVWPFETGLRLPMRGQKVPLVLHAEIYPAVLKEITPLPGKPKDAAQVLSLAKYFAKLDEEGELTAFFDGPDDLSDKERSLVCSEEGWILGVE